MMKKTFALAVALLLSCAIFATGIDRQQAAQLARDFMSKSFSKKSAARRAARTVPLHAVETGQSLVYAFNIEGGGYVVVAGDDCVPAILGFSETSEIDPQDIPDGMKYLFEHKEEDFFYINWGWYGNQDEAFRMQLCQPRKKHEGGGAGTQGYACAQQAIIGIKPATTPQHIEPVPKGYFRWITNDSYERASINDDFDLTNAVNQWFVNLVHVTQYFGYGLVVKKEDGTVVKEMLPLSAETENFRIAPGRQMWFKKKPLKLGAGLGDGTYTLEFRYRIGEGGTWHSFNPVFPVMFKIKGNKLSFDSCTEWLDANMIVTKLEGAEQDSYSVVVNLKNNSTDKTFQRSLLLTLDDVSRADAHMRVPVMLEPGEEKTFSLSFDNFKVTPTEAVDDEYADYIITGRQATVSGKIINPEDNAFNGLVMIRRYVTDFSKEPEQDEDGEYYIDCDKIYATDVTIPAKGSIDYTQLFDMDGLITDKNYSVLVDFVVTVIPDKTGEEQLLYYSDSYLLNDGTPTSLSPTPSPKGEGSWYTLQGLKLDKKPTAKGVYIYKGKKVVIK